MLAASGRVTEALALLDAAATRGHAGAIVVEASWFLSGRFVTRDLARARALFEAAARRGHAGAQVVHEAFLANGTGGERRWPEAVAALRDRSRGDAAARRQLAVLEGMALDASGDPTRVPIARELSASPRIVVLPHFLSRVECDYLIAAAVPLLGPSMVVDPRTGALIRDTIRTSDAAAFPLADESPVIHALNRRIAAATATDAAQGEPLQVLSYAPGQEYRPHLDTLPGAANQRTYTVLVYLNESYEGGETIFPTLGLTVRAGTGDALAFGNLDAVGRPDERLRHAGLPVRRGRKLLASRWIRARALDLSSPSASAPPWPR